MTGEDTRGRWLALTSLCLGFFLLMLDSTITSVAIPAMMRGFSTSESVVMWVNSGYLLGFAVPLLSTGRLGDRFGHRRVYCWGLTVFVASSLGCAVSGSVQLLVVLRVLQGVGAALMTPQCLTLMRAIFDGRELAIALAVWSSAGGAAAALGPLAGGVLVDGWGWRAIFLVNLPVGLLGLCAVLRWVPRTPSRSVPPGVLAMIGTACGALLVTIGIQGVDATSRDAWGIPRVLWAVVGLALIWVVFRAQRSSGRDALIPPELLRAVDFRRAAYGAGSAAFCVGSASIPLMLYLQNTRELDALQAALALTPMGVMCVLIAPIAARLNADRGPRLTAIVGSGALILSVALTGVLVALDVSVIAVSAGFALFGAANALVWSPFSLTAVSAVPRELVSTGSAVFNAMKQFGAVLGSAVTAVLLVPASYAAVLGVLAACGGLSLLCAVRLPADRPSDEAEASAPRPVATVSTSIDGS